MISVTTARFSESTEKYAGSTSSDDPLGNACGEECKEHFVRTTEMSVCLKHKSLTKRLIWNYKSERVTYTTPQYDTTLRENYNNRNHVNIKRHTYYCLYFVAFAYFKIFILPWQRNTSKLIGIEDVTLARIDITVLL